MSWQTLPGEGVAGHAQLPLKLGFRHTGTHCLRMLKTLRLLGERGYHLACVAFLFSFVPTAGAQDKVQYVVALLGPRLGVCFDR